MFAFYNLNNSRSVTRVFNEMSNIIYGQPVEWNGKYYERTEFVAKTGKSTNYEDIQVHGLLQPANHYIGMAHLGRRETMNHLSSTSQKKKMVNHTMYMLGWQRRNSKISF